MGQAKKRRAEIKALKTSSPSKKLLAAAMHECAHALADLHYDYRIGEEGVWVRWEDEEVRGFVDSKPTEKLGRRTIGELMLQDPEAFLAYAVGCIAGPVGEFFFWDNEGRALDYIFEKCERRWLADFAAAMGKQGKIQARAVAFAREEYENALALLRSCFAILFSELEGRKGETPALPPMTCGALDVAPLIRTATIEASNLVLLYDAEIRDLARLLIESPNYALTPEEIYAWAEEHFKRKNLREQVKEGQGKQYEAVLCYQSERSADDRDPMDRATSRQPIRSLQSPVLERPVAQTAYPHRGTRPLLGKVTLEAAHHRNRR